MPKWYGVTHQPVGLSFTGRRLSFKSSQADAPQGYEGNPVPGLYVALEAPFLGMVQVIVYTGAVMMLFLFVLMIVGVVHVIADSFWEPRDLLAPATRYR